MINVKLIITPIVKNGHITKIADHDRNNPAFSEIEKEAMFELESFTKNMTIRSDLISRLKEQYPWLDRVDINIHATRE